MQDAGRIVMIDAAADGNPMGTVTRTVPRFSRDYPPTLTAHDVGIKDLLDLFYMLDGGREVVLYAITIDPQQPISMNLSPVDRSRPRTRRVERDCGGVGAVSGQPPEVSSASLDVDG